MLGKDNTQEKYKKQHCRGGRGGQKVKFDLSTYILSKIVPSDHLLVRNTVGKLFEILFGLLCAISGGSGETFRAALK